MQKEPVPEKPGRFARFRRLPGWKKALLGIAVFVFALFVVAAILPLFSRAREAARKAPEYALGRGGMSLNIDMSKADLEAARSNAMSARDGFMQQGKAAGSADASMRLATLAEAPAPGGAPAQTSMPTPPSVSGTQFPRLDTWDRQLILNASIGLEVKDVRAAYDRVQIAAAAEGALVTSASLEAGPVRAADTRPSYGHATVVLRMPQERFSEVRRRLIAVASQVGGKVLRDEISSQDVTEEYVDLKSRLNHWRSQETQLLEIMRQARRIPDILAVRNQLSDVQQEIERITGRLRFLANRVDLSTITVDIYQKGKAPHPVQPTIASTWRNAGKTVAATCMRSLRDVVYLLGLIAAAVIYVLPFAIIAGIVYAIVRSARKRARAAATTSAP
jgi:hypothetical protein